MSMYKGYVIIPAYCPDTVLPALTTTVCDLGYTVIVVNDGSGEQYNEVFSALDPRVTLLVHEVNRGKGAALKTAYTHIRNLLKDPNEDSTLCT